MIQSQVLHFKESTTSYGGKKRKDIVVETCTKCPVTAEDVCRTFLFEPASENSGIFSSCSVFFIATFLTSFSSCFLLGISHES